MKFENRKISPLVSIITVVFNGEKYLKQTIDSVIGQTYKNIEYIVIDGGSTDGTIDIIKSYQDKISTWVSERDKGLYDAMNKGIAMANGELIGMINSDDWYDPNAVEIVVSSFNTNPTKKIFHGDRYDILEDGSRRLKKFHPSNFKFIYYGMTYNHPSMFVHKDIYENEKFNTELRALSDYEFVLKNYKKEPNAFYYIPNAYVNYRLDGLSGTMPGKDMLKEGYISRKNAGLGVFQNCFSLLLRLSVRAVFYLKKVRLV